jgi:transcriptional regulator with XRE-family HTH domain
LESRKKFGTKRNVIGPNIKKVREKKNLTQSQLAAKLEVLGFQIDWSGISKIERQRRGLNDVEIILIAEALQVKVDDLLPLERPIWLKDTRHPNARESE